MIVKPRRIVTGIDEEGNSIIQSNKVLDPSIELGENAFIELWQTDNKALDRKNFEEISNTEVKLSPERDSTKIRYFQLPPINKDITSEEMESFYSLAFETINASHERTDIKKHPGMHLTNSIDYIVLLKGKVKLILDSDEISLNPLDVVIQRGTSHAWSVIGSEPALLLAVLIDKRFAN